MGHPMKKFLVVALTLIAGPVSAGPLADKTDRFDVGARAQMPVGDRVALAKRVVLANLRDADSAKFRNVRVVTTFMGTAVCGEVNARNAMGGYVGFTEFVTANDVLFLAEGDAVDEFAARQTIHYSCGYAVSAQNRTVTPVQF
jgi:hypothetical protein